MTKKRRRIINKNETKHVEEKEEENGREVYQGREKLTDRMRGQDDGERRNVLEAITTEIDAIPPMLLDQLKLRGRQTQTKTQTDSSR